MADDNRKVDRDGDLKPIERKVDQKIDADSEDIQRKAEREANPLAPPVNTRAS